MHSSILSQVLNTVFNWISNYDFPWDSSSFTIIDYFCFCCILYVISYFVHHIIFFIFRQYERYIFGS